MPTFVASAESQDTALQSIPQKRRAMSHHEEHTHHNKKQRKSDEAQQIMQERTELLDVIREMINVEIERRGVGAGECPHSCKPPPEARLRRRTFITAINAINPDEQLKAIEDVMTKFKNQSLEQSLYLENLYKKITADDGKNSRLKAIEAAILAMSDYGGKIDGIKQEILDLIKAVNDGTSSVEDAWAEIGKKIDELKGETGGGSGSGTTDDSAPIPYDVVDLGLPSGLLWSKWNLGGKAVGDAGDYYAWGELEPKTEFTKRNYRFFNEAPVHYSKYNDMDKLYMLQSEDDVATQKLGKWYRLPSDDDWQELLDNCTWEPITTTVLTETVVAGWKVKGKNGNEIVLPSTGYYDEGSELRMTFTFYQSSTIHVDYNYYTVSGTIEWAGAAKKKDDGGVEISRPKIQGLFRYSGSAVRPVCDIK